ncbi:MAG: TPM domain-containing protein [Bosea sp. (in: a-proteobacteria)]
MKALEQADLDRIADAVRCAEAVSAAEIIVVVEQAAGTYRSLSLVFAWLVAFIVPWPLIWLTSLSAQVIFIIQLGAALVLAIIVSIRQSWRMALTPRFIKRQKAHEAACREFILRGLVRTKSRSGVLIYVALAERYAEVLVDTGIAAKIDNRRWQEVVNPLIEAIREGRLADGLIRGVDQIGDSLAPIIPANGQEDELPNKVVLIS